MSLFEFTVQPKSLDDLDNKIQKILGVVENLKPDRKFLSRALNLFNVAMKNYGDDLIDISKLNLNLEGITVTEKISNSLLNELEDLGNIYLKSAEIFETNVKRQLDSLMDEKVQSKVEEIRRELSNFLDKIQSERTHYDKISLPHIKSEEDLEISRKQLHLCLLKRYDRFDKIIELQLDFINAKELAEKNKIIVTNYLTSLSSDFNSALDNLLNELQELFINQLKELQTFLKSYFESLKEDLNTFSGDFPRIMKRAKRGFNTESESTSYSIVLIGKKGSVDFSMYENLMENEDVQETSNKIQEKSVAIMQSLAKINEMFIEAHKELYNKLNDLEVSISASPNISTFARDICTLISALKDIFVYKSKLFEQEIKYTRYFMSLMVTFHQAMNDFYLKNGASLTVEKKESPKIEVEMKEFVGFDQSFFSALDEPLANIPEPKFNNSKNIAEKIFEELNKELNVPPLTRKEYLHLVEKYFRNMILWLKNSFYILFNTVSSLNADSSSIIFALYLTVENNTIINIIPTIKGDSHSLDEFRKAIEKRTKQEALINETLKKKEQNDKMDEAAKAENDEKNFMKNIDPAIYERFIGEEEANKAKEENLNKANNVNFFSYLIENFDDEPPKVEDTSLNHKFKVSTVPGANKPTHTLNISQKTLDVTIINSKGEKELEFNLKSFSMLSISKDTKDKKSANNSKSTKHPFRNVVLQAREGETKKFNIFGNDAEILRFKALIAMLFKNAINRVIGLKSINFEIQMSKESKKKKKKEKKEKKTEGILAMNIMWLHYIFLDSKKYNIDSFKMHKDDVEKRILMELLCEPSDVLVEFKNYEERDCFFSLVNKMIANKVTNTGITPSNDLNLWVGMWTFEKSTTIKPDDIIEWIPQNADIAIIVFSGVNKSNEKNCKNFQTFINQNSKSLFANFTYKMHKDIVFMLLTKKDLSYYVHSLLECKQDNMHGISFRVEDSSYLFLIPNTYQIDENLADKYMEILDRFNFFENEYKDIYTFDNVFVLYRLDQETPVAQETDSVNKAFTEKKLLPGFFQLAFEDNKPISNQIFWKSDYKDSDDMKPIESKSLYDCITNSVNPFSAMFKQMPRNTPVNYNFYNPNGQSQWKENFFCVLWEIEIVPNEDKALGRADLPLFILLIHYSTNTVFVSNPAHFDEQNHVYTWKKLGESIEQICLKSQHSPQLWFYVKDSNYIQKTSIKIIIGNRESGIIGYGSIKILEPFFSEDGETFSSNIYSAGNLIGKINGKIAIQLLPNPLVTV